MLFRLIDRMALFTLSHLLLYVRGETAENSPVISINIASESFIVLYIHLFVYYLFKFYFSCCCCFVNFVNNVNL